MKSKPQILITGGTGLVGSHLLAKLCFDGISVRAIYRKSSQIDKVKKVFSYYSNSFESVFENIEWVESDLNDLPALSPVFDGITEVYHCAAMVSFNKRDYDTMRKVNIEGTANMVNLSIHNGVKKFCYVSSIATIDKNPNLEFVDEQSEWNPENNNYGYAISKYGGEMEVWRGSQEGLNVVVVNPGVILGSGFWDNNTGLFFKNSYKGFRFYTEGVTGFVGVYDVVKAMTLLMKSPITNERFVLVSENKSFQYVFTHIANAMKTRTPDIKVTPWMSEIGWRLAAIGSFFTKKTPLITKQSAKAAHHKIFYSSQKIINLLGFKFENLTTTIDRCVRDFMVNK